MDEQGVNGYGSPGRRIRVLIAEDDRLFRAALAEVISTDAALDLVGAAEDAEDAIALADRAHPDVALVDVRMPAGGGVRATEGIRACSPDTRVIAVSAHTERSVVLEMVRAGAAGYVVKGASMGEILDSVHRSLRGEVSLDGEVARDVVAELAGRLERQRRYETEFDRREERVRTAMRDGRLVAVFQPIARLYDGEVVGVEALARFDSALRESPLPWFEEAETVDLRTELELAAVSAAVEAAATVGENLWVSVNVSPATAMATDELLAALAPGGTHRIVIEITEQAEVDDYAGLNRALTQLRSAGVLVAVDDAGAGYASLRHILRLAPDFIKLDGTLVRGIHTDRALRALATALISFAAEIGATIVAEGIETRRDLDALRDLGVELGQGFHLARPHPPPVESLVAVA
jgi:EAL domain-containing protein (putative c-di-GMP-specific phosphodiesterase class I)/ActR/RegA family two-component response regulator